MTQNATGHRVMKAWMRKSERTKIATCCNSYHEWYCHWILFNIFVQPVKKKQNIESKIILRQQSEAKDNENHLIKYQANQLKNSIYC